MIAVDHPCDRRLVCRGGHVGSAAVRSGPVGPNLRRAETLHRGRRTRRPGGGLLASGGESPKFEKKTSRCGDDEECSRGMCDTRSVQFNTCSQSFSRHLRLDDSYCCISDVVVIVVVVV